VGDSAAGAFFVYAGGERAAMQKRHKTKGTRRYLRKSLIINRDWCISFLVSNLELEGKYQEDYSRTPFIGKEINESNKCLDPGNNGL